MSTSDSVDNLTYTYYTGQDGSVPNGPNCHGCMNQLFRENSLVDVQFAYVSTPMGFIALTIRSLVFFNGVETPFTVPGFTEDTDEIEQITRKRKLAPDCSSNIGTESFDEKDDIKIPSYVIHETKPIMPAIDADSSRLCSTDTKSLNRPPMVNSPVSNHDIITSIKHENESSQSPLIDISGSDGDDEHGNLTGSVNNITSYSLAVTNAATNGQFVNPYIGNETTPAVNEESQSHIMNFIFLRARQRSETLDDMTKKELVKKMHLLKSIMQSRVLYVDSKCSASKKMFHCEYCDSIVRSGGGVAMVDHFFSNRHITSVYEKGFVFSSADFNRQLEIFSQMQKETIRSKRNIIRTRQTYKPTPDVDFPFPGVLNDQSIEPVQDVVVLDDSSDNSHLSIMLVDFPFARGKLRDQVTDPMQDFTELESFSRDLTDVCLTSVVQYNFPCKVIDSDRVFSVSGDLSRLKKMCHYSIISKGFKSS